MKHEKYGDERIDEILSIPPEKRVLPTGDELEDQIRGILVGFAQLYGQRDGHIDFITTQYAVAEIRELMKSQTKKKPR